MRGLPRVRAEHAMHAAHAHHAGSGDERFLELLIMTTARVPRASSSGGDSHSWRTLPKMVLCQIVQADEGHEAQRGRQVSISMVCGGSVDDARSQLSAAPLKEPSR